MNVGFIVRDKRRLALLKDLHKEPHSLERLARKNRLKMVIAEKALEPLVEEEAVRREGDIYSLTGKGEEMARTIAMLERANNLPSSGDGEREGAVVRIAPNHKRRQIDIRR